MKNALFFLLFSTLVLTGCTTSRITEQAPIFSNDIAERERKLKRLTQWNVAGKIAFIQGKERQSANILWQVDQLAEQQSLNMTTYLGISVLSLKQTNEVTTIEVDGESYQGDDLELLIWRLTGLTLPAEAIQYWIKGIPYLPSDTINFGANNLPTSLSSEYDNQSWQVAYQQYKVIDGHELATKMTIKQDQLTIKLAINRWELTQ